MKEKPKTVFCTAFDCLIITCSRHRCHSPKKFNSYNWTDQSGTCGMYKSKNAWRTVYQPPEREDDYYEEEDDSDLIDEI